jgi:hypothetical protein
LWAQLIEMRLKPDEDTTELIDLMRAVEQPGSGLIRSLFMRDQADPDRVVTLAVFESEDTAREREANPRRAKRLAAARSITATIRRRPTSVH